MVFNLIRSFNPITKYFKFNKISKFYSSFTITEVRVPISNTDPSKYIAGKLWEHKSSTTENINVENSTPLICMHGYLDNASTFDNLIPLIIKSGMKILAFDLLGHGLSSHTKIGFYEYYVEAMVTIIKILDYFKWDKADFLCHSLGAQIVFVFASVYPKFVDRFVAVDNFRCVHRSAQDYVKYVLNTYFEVDQKLSSSKNPPSYTWEEIVTRSYEGRGGSPNISRENCEVLLRRGAKKLENGKFQFTHDLKTTIPTQYGRFSKDQTEEFAKNLKGPICVIKAEPGADYEPREFFMASVDLARKYAKHLEFHLVPGSHYIHLNDPQSISPIISKFLQR